VWDLEDGYKTYLTKHFQDATGKIPKLNLGKNNGDLLKVPEETLEGNVDLLIAGCPCPPWAGNGSKKGTSDPRFKVFIAVINWILWLAERHGLIGICLENVKGTMNCIAGREPFYPRLKKILEDVLPMFRYRIDTLEAEDYKSCAKRTRVLLRGLHVKFAPQGVPPPLPPMPKVELKDNLGKFPNTDTTTMTKPQQQNLKDQDKYILRERKAGRIPEDAIVMFAADRAFGMVYKPELTVNRAPCLTCHNRYLFLVKASEAGLPKEQRSLYRFAHPAERLHWQGFPAKEAYQALGPAKSLKGAGNCYPVGLMFAGLIPMARTIANSGVDLAQWPPKALADDSAKLKTMKAKVKKELTKKPRKVIKKAKAKATAGNMAQAKAKGKSMKRAKAILEFLILLLKDAFM